MIPGELFIDDGDHTLNPGRRTCVLVVINAADRPIQVGSHYHFAETNAALGFDREAARGMRLNIASGTAVRFEPGQEGMRGERMAAPVQRVPRGRGNLIQPAMEAELGHRRPRRAYSCLSRNLSASSAAMQPEPAEVMAWR